MPSSISSADEQRRVPDGSAGWQETFSFEAATPGGPCLLVRWSLHRNSCWYWAYLTESTGSVVAVRDHSLALPRGRTLAARGEGLWSDGVCEVPLEHWSLSLEAFAVRMDEVVEGWGEERGEIVPFGFELDWEATAPAAPTAGGYVQPGRLVGDLVLGRESRDIDLTALRSHRVRTAEPTTPRAELRVLDGAEPRVIGSIVADEPDEPDEPPVRVHREESGVVRGAVAGPFTFTADRAVAVPTPGLRTCVAAGALATAGGDELLAWLEALG